MSKKWIYLFREGNASWKDLLGGKGAGLAGMTIAGMPVPPGFTITTEVCNAYYDEGKKFPDGMWEQAMDALKVVEQQMDRQFGDPVNPLLVSVRSGAKFSMPGMMDTILNLGLNDTTIKGLIASTGNERFAYDAYRRFVQMYGNVVLNINKDSFEHVLDAYKHKIGPKAKDTDLTTEDLRAIKDEFKAIVLKETGSPFPEEPLEQLKGAIEAVFASWNNDRAIYYRQVNKISDALGTAVNVQTMVFGNMGDDSGTGVAFTRDPATGENVLYGEYLPNAQGEDVVAGIRTPHPISDMEHDPNFPGVYKQFREIAHRLEAYYKDVQDMEFTIEKGRLFMLQTRNGKRTGPAAVKIAVDLVREGVIDEATALQRVPADDLTQLLLPRVDPVARAHAKFITKGLAGSPGAAVGQVVFTAEEAEALGNAGQDVILVRRETSPEDLRGMVAARGILTAFGGKTSHAAVVARGMGKCCIVGAGSIHIAKDASGFSIDDTDVVIKKGDWITLDVDSNEGRVLAGRVKTIAPEMSGDFATLMEWTDKFRKLQIRANADTPQDALKAREFGAQGIGLTRTEHMFFEGNRIMAIREMILSDNQEDRKKALEKILPYQKEDFVGIFKAMDGFPVTIRTLDPPLHEFLPHEDAQIVELAQEMGISVEKVKNRIEYLKESNPMLGFRGCRLGIQYPEITEMQARAIFRAALEVKKEGVNVHPEIMIPLVSDVNELKLQRDIVERVALEEGVKEAGLAYSVGTMIELPRAALTADKIAEVAEFFSFGTNDLTQTTFGLSRDDSGKFLPLYVERKILKDDPFQALDREGVGQLLKIGTERGRSTRPNLKVGICGEHGGEPSSVEFCHQINLNYVSCSPFRVPIARLAAAQAAIGETVRDK
ncbi:MAG: pyruvate, phosphate dikinase [Chloroflexi bacterium]|uniref:Pyruvate, phosphate dikinase n=1 Tax=Candidatus Chlorohelix allophototropha TaxID=3003348 RepID=A0A8T7LUN9_9CHLR|nr:pyruvate, phosphate dikinase [Chloroflexota bacterium]WJW66468.1 pyruvate, phosphate dikinase [Chloroflexota bacterium L227-S17]